ncbi:hypothetical protein [Flavobacterium noncentrifugens]|uniref:AZL_007920/MXAN_0976 family protein n=1 Tax=Flavobacterium noncentrifugens TaxID=1128970 RepID=A0A1G8SLN0_9FLAO|nr:hypothetical protein [Flavobacterium noncentrifugens]SDJ29645.1 hypothetical protein SAMN04487935_0595 [Flavobacterium noncentrifugens]
MKIKLFGIALLLLALGFCCISCEKDDDVAGEPMLIVKFKFDKDQQRLDNIGQPSKVALGNAAQSPDFNSISAHYLEFAPTANTQLGKGAILYHGTETTMGGKNAIDFNQAKVVSEGETFLQIPLSKLAKGNYEWVRVSLAYQNYGISVRNSGKDYSGTLASFVGFNTYISSFDIDNAIFNVNENRSQGYWAFKLDDNPYSTEGQAPEGATTVPNPIAATSPVASGSCVVTGRFPNKLSITGNETKNIVVTLSLSVNHSFEWHEIVADGKYEPSKGEQVVDMGLRGLIPAFQTSYNND